MRENRSMLLSVGHGRLDRSAFGALLSSAGVDALVDIRRFPGSRHNPDVAADALAVWLPELGIAYRTESRLGGRRRLAAGAPREDPWWQVDQFAAYAAHTRTPEFQAALAELLEEAGRVRTVMMCSESVWWRCHRRLIADVAVLVHDVAVHHLAHDGRLSPHLPAAGARVVAGQLRYDRPR
jgi:uncharacterized protein (DUF488 family)